MSTTELPTAVKNRLTAVEDKVDDLLSLRERVAALEARVDDLTTDDAEGDWHDINGLRVTQNPDEYLLRNKTGETENGIPIYEEGPEHLVPSNVTTYMSSERPGDVKVESEVRKKLGRGRAIMLEGEAGTGKNTLLDGVAADGFLPVYRSNFGLDTSVYEIIAEKDVVGGTTVITLKDLALAAIFGGVFVADEANMVEGDVSSHLHAAAEEKGKRRVEIVGTGRVLTDLPEDEEWDPEKHLGKYIHPAFRFAATGNPISYSGTADMNDAFRGRMSITGVDYPAAQGEAGLLVAETDADLSTARTLVEDVAQPLRALRDGTGGQSLQCPIAYRQLRNTLEYMQDHNVTLKEAAKAELVSYAQFPQDKTTIEDTIDDML